jgi:hypothetical protein
MADEPEPVPEVEKPKPPTGFHMVDGSFLRTKLVDDDTTGWEFYGNNGKKVSECDGVSLIGGYGVFGKGAGMKRTFSDLGPHSKIVVAF